VSAPVRVSTSNVQGAAGVDVDAVAHHLRGQSPAGATSWTSGERRRRPPAHRHDHVLAPSGSVVEDATVLDDRREQLDALPDRLPPVATVTFAQAGRTGR